MNYKMGGLNKLLKNNLFKCLIELLFKKINLYLLIQIISIKEEFYKEFRGVRKGLL